MPPFPIAPLRKFSESLMTDETLRLRTMFEETEEGYPRSIGYYDTLPTKSYGIPLSASELITANQMGYQVDSKRYLPFDADVVSGDKLQVGDNVYEIVSILSDGTEGLLAHLEVWVRRVDSEGSEF